MATRKDTRGIFTSEFALTIATMVLGLLKAHVFPDIPEEAFFTVIAYILGRVVVKTVPRSR